MEEITRDQIQTEALKAIENHKKGTICLSTGTGKSKIAIDFIKEQEDIHFVLITSPRTNLKDNWEKELTKWGLVLVPHRSERRWRIGRTDRYVWIDIENVQTAYKWSDEKYDLIIADEVHTMMTPEYSSLFENNPSKYLIGLTATHDITSKNDKGFYYKKYCPIIYEYYNSANDGLINKTRFFIVDHTLTNEFKVQKIIRKKKELVLEASYYEHLTERIKSGQKQMMAQGSENWFSDAANWFWNNNGTPTQKYAAMMYLNAIKSRKDFLLKLNSTATIAEKIKNGILDNIPQSKVLLFSELTAQVEKFTKNTIHSKNHKDINTQRMDDFNSGLIHDLGSCHSLTLGLNFIGATHAIMESYIGSATKSKQKKGRLDRLETDNVADLWIIRVVGTQSESWFNEMTKGFDFTNAMYINSNIILNDKFDFLGSKIN